MRDIALVRKKVSVLCLRTTQRHRSLIPFTRQFSKLCSPLQQNSISDKLLCCESERNYIHLKSASLLHTSSQQLQKQQRPWLPKQQQQGFVHDFDEEVEILSHTHSDIGWGVRLAAENGYLSWMRNTYITTVAGVAMINSSVAPLAPVAGSGVFLIAGLNMFVGSVGFIYNLRKLKKGDHISAFWTTISQLLTALHFILWCSILIVFLPDIEKVENSLKED